MSRGFKKDLPATEAAHFADSRSFISLPKIIVGECTEPKPHFVLYGKDIGPMRALIFQLDREKNAGVNRCYKCGHRVFEGDEWPGRKGEWDHIRNKPGTRCDDISNARIACHHCHSERHPQPRFGRHEKNTLSHAHNFLDK